MSEKTLQKRLSLLAEANSKIDKMKTGSAFVTDFGACRLLERLLESYRDLMADNLELKKQLKLHATAQKLKNKTLDSKKRRS